MSLYRAAPAVSLHERVTAAGAASHISDLAILGYTVVPGILAPYEVTEFRAIADEMLASDVSVADPCGRRVWGVLRRDRRFARVLADHTVDLLLDYLVGESRRLSSLHINAIHQGAAAQAIHTDVPFVAPPLPSPPLLANTIWCLDDWSPGHGATEVTPGSHTTRTHPPAESAPDDMVTVECEAGSVIVTNGNLWHRSGQFDVSGTGVSSRVAVLALYCRSHLTPQEDYADLGLTLSPAIASRLCPKVPYPFDDRGPTPRFSVAQALADSPYA